MWFRQRDILSGKTNMGKVKMYVVDTSYRNAYVSPVKSVDRNMKGFEYVCQLCLASKQLCL